MGALKHLSPTCVVCLLLLICGSALRIFCSLTHVLKGITSAPTNPAKCAGSKQNHTDQIGTLDCATFTQSTSHVGDKCLDNLSHAAFWTADATGKGVCIGFSKKAAFTREALVTSTSHADGKFRNGLLSKLFSAAVDTTNMNVTNRKRYGVISGKRMVCTDSMCHVYKVGMCIKCPAPVFSSVHSHKVTSGDIQKFALCCVTGKDATQFDASFKKAGGTCDQVFEDAGGAFTQAKTAAATLKDSYQCWDGTDEDTDGLNARDLAIATIKVS